MYSWICSVFVVCDGLEIILAVPWFAFEKWGYGIIEGISSCLFCSILLLLVSVLSVGSPFHIYLVSGEQWSEICIWKCWISCHTKSSNATWEPLIHWAYVHIIVSYEQFAPNGKCSALSNMIFIWLKCMSNSSPVLLLNWIPDAVVCWGSIWYRTSLLVTVYIGLSHLLDSLLLQ